MNKSRNNRSARIGAYARFIFTILLGNTAIAIVSGHPRVKISQVFNASDKLAQIEKHTLQRALHRLEQQDMIESVQEGYETWIQLTKEGQHKAMRMQVRDMKIPKPSRWDGQWHLICFDIPEYVRLGRDTLRQMITSWGFYQIQKSVYIYPYPCEDEIVAIARSFQFERFVHCFTLAKLSSSYERHLKNHFAVH